MAIVMARVDERLIHGQMALAWLRQYKVDTVIVIDDESANDMMKTMLLQMAVSGTIKCIVTALADAKGVIEANKNKNLFLCSKLPIVLLELLKQGVAIPQINIGGIYSAPGRIPYYKTIFLDDEIKRDIIALEQYPVKVEYRMVPGDPEIDIISELKNKSK